MARTEHKGTAELRASDLSPNSTRYEYLLAAPSDEQLTRYWTAWAVVSLVGGCFVAIVLVGVLCSRPARQRSFNWYLMYLMLPDALYSILCGIVCGLHASQGHQVASMCNFQTMFIVWGVGSNMWLNAAVTQQLHGILRHSMSMRRYSVPTRRHVTKQAFLIYGAMLFLGTWGWMESPKFPHYVASTSGLACLPVEQDWSSSLFFWIVFFPLFGGIPMLYIQYVCYDIWKRNLMPPRGKRRLFAIFFGRIVIVFVVMWIPYMILLFMLTTFMPTWVHFYGGTLSHLQGAVSAALCLYKPDIYLAVQQFVKGYACGCRRKLPQPRQEQNGDEDNEQEHHPEGSSWFWASPSSSRRRTRGRLGSFFRYFSSSNDPSRNSITSTTAATTNIHNNKADGVEPPVGTTPLSLLKTSSDRRRRPGDEESLPALPNTQHNSHSHNVDLERNHTNPPPPMDDEEQQQQQQQQQQQDTTNTTTPEEDMIFLDSLWPNDNGYYNDEMVDDDDDDDDDQEEDSVFVETATTTVGDVPNTNTTTTDDTSPGSGTI